MRILKRLSDLRKRLDLHRFKWNKEDESNLLLKTLNESNERKSRRKLKMKCFRLRKRSKIKKKLQWSFKKDLSNKGKIKGSNRNWMSNEKKKPRKRKRSESRNLIKMKLFALTIWKRTKKTLSNCSRSIRNKKRNTTRFKRKKLKCMRNDQKRKMQSEKERDNNENKIWKPKHLKWWLRSKKWMRGKRKSKRKRKNFSSNFSIKSKKMTPKSLLQINYLSRNKRSLKRSLSEGIERLMKG